MRCRCFDEALISRDLKLALPDSRRFVTFRQPEDCRIECCCRSHELSRTSPRRARLENKRGYLLYISRETMARFIYQLPAASGAARATSLLHFGARLGGARCERRRLTAAQSRCNGCTSASKRPTERAIGRNKGLLKSISKGKLWPSRADKPH